MKLTSKSKISVSGCNRTVGLTAICAGLLLTNSVFAQSSTVVSVSGVYGNNNTPLNVSVSNTNPGFGTSSATLPVQVYDGGNAFGLANAQASEGPGHIGVMTNLSADSGYYGVNLTVTAQAFYYDSLLIVAPGLPVGTVLTINGSWDLDGSTETGAHVSTPPPPGNPGASIDIDTLASVTADGVGFPGSDILQSDEKLIRNSNEPGDFNLPGLARYPAVFDIAIGVPTTFSVELKATSAVVIVNRDNTTNAAHGTANAITDFSHTLSWGGISSVTDQNGNPITGWTVTSESGFDYSQPFVDVPEPSVFALLAVALPGLLLARRCSQRVATYPTC